MEVNKHLVTNNENTYLGITCQKPKFPQYAVVAKRLGSFKTWPEYLPVKPETLADAGLVYTGVGDSVRCYFCGGGLRNFDRGDSAWFEHAKWYPTCTHVLLVKGQGFVDRVKRGENPDRDGQLLVSKPVSEDGHLNSPAAQSCLQNGFSECAVKRAIALFIKNHGVGDSVRCYFCGGGLRNFDRGDSAWFEHAKWYPTCTHVLLVKGQGFVDRVKRGENPDRDGQLLVSKPVSEDGHLNSPAAQSCLQNGFSECAVKRAIALFIKKHGNANFKGADLCQLIIQQDKEANLTKRGGATNIMDGVKSATGSLDDNEQIACGTDEKEEDFDQLYEENRRLKENKLCKICLDESANIIFLPCGHMVSCPQCAPALVKCPMCRMTVKGYVKAYFAQTLD